MLLINIRQKKKTIGNLIKSSTMYKIYRSPIFDTPFYNNNNNYDNAQ